MLLTRLALRIATALDLHVLSLPPAFALSQDQTLKLDENFDLTGHVCASRCSRITTFDEVHPLIFRSAMYLKRRPSEVSSKAATYEESLLRKKAARKDLAVHVSLSSYSLVKQPGIGRPQLSGCPESARSSKRPITVGRCFTVPVRSYTGTQSRR